VWKVPGPTQSTVPANLGVGLSALAGTVLLGPASWAATVNPFPTGPGLVFVAQGPARGEPTTLFEAVQGADAITFQNIQTAPRAAVGYNAVGFHLADRFRYGINDNNALDRIGMVARSPTGVRWACRARRPPHSRNDPFELMSVDAAQW
jgi:hypothetical protein